MKYSKQQKEAVLKPTIKQCANKNQTGFKKSTNSARGRKVLGSSEHLLSLDAMISTASRFSKRKSSSIPDKENNSLIINQLSSTKHKRVTVQIPLAPQKFKLQLFPLDDRIRMGLEKDGHNPHLELTLSARKKIPSVLLHMNNKWGKSSVALGELILFPFNTVPENTGSCRRWNMDDKDVSAGDVHAAIGSPTVFRLRYSWFPVQSNYVEVPDALTSALICQEDSNAALGSSTDDVWAQLIGEELEQGSFSDIMDLISDTDPYNFEEHRVNENITQLSALFADSDSDISFEALLSDSSLIEEFNLPTQTSPECNSAFRSTQLVPDSLDSFINDLQSQPESGTTFMRDSVNTCHSFAVEAPSSSGQDLLGECNELLFEGDAGAKSDNLLYALEQESKTGALTFQNDIFNSEESHGLSSHNWNDSMGSWDIGLSTQQMINGDSFNLSELVW